jgi:DNA-binding CsgD family transcriptional regulator
MSSRQASTPFRPAMPPDGGGFDARDHARDQRARDLLARDNWARVVGRIGAIPPDTLRKWRLLADMCRVLGARATGLPAATPAAAPVGKPAGPVTPEPASRPPAVAVDVPLSPRVRQTLDRLLCGDSEKQVARQLGVSQHTVHVYVKTLYRKLCVNTRGELLAKFVRPPA